MKQPEAPAELIEDSIQDCVEKLIAAHGRYDNGSEAAIAELHVAVPLGNTYDGQAEHPSLAPHCDRLSIFKAADPRSALYTWEVLIDYDRASGCSVLSTGKS